MDLGMLTYVLGSIKTEFHLTAAQSGLLGSMSFVGMFIGAAASGMVADRFGRRVVFQWSMVVWGIASLLCAWSPSIGWLIAFRILLGIGMGMEFPIGQSLVCEFIPAKNRGRYIALLEGFWPIGFIAAGILASILLPHFGWRGVFVAEGIPAIFVLAIRRMVPESPRWLESVGRTAEADAVMTNFESHVQAASGGQSLPEPMPGSAVVAAAIRRSTFGDLWAEGYARRTVMVWVLWFFALLGYYGLTTWLGALLQAKGYAVVKSTQYITLISLAGVPGFFFAAWLIEAWGRKSSLVLMLAGSAVMAFLYGHAGNFAQLILFGLLMQFFLFGMWSVLYAYTPELYPTHARATGAGFASSVGRLGALIGPYVVGLVLPTLGQGGVFGLGAVSFVIAAVFVALLGEETRGRTLEEICPVRAAV
jgi:MFS transporter, putative metabolite:H+ symporter